MYTVNLIGVGFLDPATFHLIQAWGRLATHVFQFHFLSIGWLTAEIWPDIMFDTSACSTLQFCLKTTYPTDADLLQMKISSFIWIKNWMWILQRGALRCVCFVPDNKVEFLILQFTCQNNGNATMKVDVMYILVGKVLVWGEGSSTTTTYHSKIQKLQTWKTKWWLALSSSHNICV